MRSPLARAAIDVVKAYEDLAVAAFLDGGSTDPMLDLISDDCVVRHPSLVPNPGEHHGKQGALTTFTGLMDAWEIVEGPGLEYIDGGPNVCVVLLDVMVRARNTGRVVRARCAEVHRVDDGRITGIDMYYFDQEAMAAARAG